MDNSRVGRVLLAVIIDMRWVGKNDDDEEEEEEEKEWTLFDVCQTRSVRRNRRSKSQCEIGTLLLDESKKNEARLSFRRIDISASRSRFFSFHRLSEKNRLDALAIFFDTAPSFEAWETHRYLKNWLGIVRARGARPNFS